MKRIEHSTNLNLPLFIAQVHLVWTSFHKVTVPFKSVLCLEIEIVKMIRRFVFLFLLSQALVFGLRKVRYAAVVYRHGDRMPVDCYPRDPYRNESLWPEPFGQLSNVGKKQHFQLGKYLRQRYAHLLSEFYDPKELFVQSTDVDRTLMSAEANLAGMYPPIGKEIWEEHMPWQPIPVHTAPEEKDEVIAMKRPCPLYDADLAAYKASPMYLSKLNKYRQFMDFLSRNTGLDVQDFTDMMLIYSCLNIETLYNFTLPAWTRHVYPSPLKTAAGISFSVSAATPRLARLRAGPLVTQVVRAMSAVAHARDPHHPHHRFHVYSGHDYTVGTVLTALGLFDDACPEYTATVFFELLQDQNTTNGEEWYVRVLYRNTPEIVEPTVLMVPGCGQLCPFDKFLHIYQHLIISDWENECNLTPSSLRDVMLCSGMVLLALCSVSWLLWIKRRNTANKKIEEHQEDLRNRYLPLLDRQSVTPSDLQYTFATPADKILKPVKLFITPADKMVCSPGTDETLCVTPEDLYNTPADKTTCSPGTDQKMCVANMLPWYRCSKTT